jgi:hypothetical protein
VTWRRSYLTEGDPLLSRAHTVDKVVEAMGDVWLQIVGL